MKVWISQAVDLEKTCEDHESALIHSMLICDFNMFQILVESGVSLETPFFFEPYCTPLMYAMERMTPACFAKTLIQNGANVHVQNEHGTVLDNLLYYKSNDDWTDTEELEITNLLIQAGHPIPLWVSVTDMLHELSIDTNR